MLLPRELCLSGIEISEIIILRYYGRKARRQEEQGASWRLAFLLLKNLATLVFLCYSMYNKIEHKRKQGAMLIIEIDFNSDEAIYIQLCNQIIMGIATDQLKVGETLPSVRQLADTIGINMHTVNKAYSVLKQEGFLTIDRRKGAVISIDADKMRALDEMKQELLVVLARGCCRNVSREEVHALIDEIFDEYE